MFQYNLRNCGYPVDLDFPGVSFVSAVHLSRTFFCRCWVGCESFAFGVVR